MDRAQQGAWRGSTQLGFEFVPDQNGEFKVGWYPLVVTNVDDKRVSAAMAYLDLATRRRPNLGPTQTFVQRLLSRAGVASASPQRSMEPCANFAPTR